MLCKVSYLDIYKRAKQITAKKPKFVHPSMSQVLARIKHIQTGNLYNPFIRTKYIPAAGSAAFGPYQMSQMLLRDLDLSKVPQRHREQAMAHLNLLRKQRELFLRHGVNAAHIAKTGIDPRKQKDWKARYNYGGTGASILGQNVFGMKNQAYIHDLIAKNYLSSIYQKAVKNSSNADDFYYIIAKSWHGSKDSAINTAYGKKLRSIPSEIVNKHMTDINQRELKYRDLDPEIKFVNPPARVNRNQQTIKPKTKPNNTSFSRYSSYQAELKRLNPGVNFKNLKLGIKLKLPGNRSTIVNKGFTGWNDWNRNFNK